MTDPPRQADLVGDSLTVKHWLAGYLVGLALAAGLFAWLMGNFDWQVDYWTGQGLSLSEKWSRFLEVFARTSPALKLLGFAIYLSICTTFFPLPTGGLVAALATRQASLAGGLDAPTIVIALVTTLAVALVGAAASTVANLNDYYLFTWMLRSHRVAKVRKTKTYRKASVWFARSPMFLLIVFNVMPIPIDLVRLLATTYRFPRLPFAVANFIGRFIRYAIIAFVTYWWNLGWIAVVSLLAVAIVLALAKLLAKLVSRLRSSNVASDEVSSQ